MTFQMLEYRIGERAVPGHYAPPPAITIQDVRQALAGTVTETGSNTPRLLESLNYAIINRTAIEARRESGTPRPSDAADSEHYDREIYSQLRRLNLFAASGA